LLFDKESFHNNPAFPCFGNPAQITVCNYDIFSFVFFSSTACLQIESIVKRHDHTGGKIFQEEEKNMKKIG